MPQTQDTPENIAQAITCLAAQEKKPDPAIRAKLQAQLASHRPYLKPEHHEQLADIYRREFRTDRYGNRILLDDAEQVTYLAYQTFTPYEDD